MTDVLTVPAPATERRSEPPAHPVTRFRWRLAPAPALPGEPSPHLRGRRIAVFGGDPVVAARVVAHLRDAGAEARLADEGIDEVPDGLVDLTVTGPYGGEPGAYRSALLRSVGAIRACYSRWAQEDAADRLCYVAVTYLGGGMGYQQDTPIAQPLGGIWAGLAKTLHREIPNCNIRVIDVDPHAVSALPALLTRELYRWGLFEVGYADGVRLTLRPEAEPVPPPRLPLGRGDLVLVSGGGRGIGFRLARSLAARGCRVVVTGRDAPPDGSEPWAGLDEAAFREYQRRMWLAGDRRELAVVRTEIDRVRRRRELGGNLDEARRAGLDIEYVRCDFTDPVQVAALLDRYGDQLTGVVHNAGVDRPARLPKKSDEDVLQTVRVKIDGFANLFAQVRTRPLRFFCNVGSLTGRLGGMVGQLDYAAANDGLARLGLWADRQVPFPVMTLAWPTWDRIGMVSNFEASLRYMSALDADEGVGHWLAELRAGTGGEVGFVGRLGRALSPTQAVGFPSAPEMPGLDQVLPRITHLGTVLRYRPAEQMSAVVRFDRASAPVLDDFVVDGVPAVPVSLLVENALRAVEWVLPDDVTDLATGDVRELVIALPRLALRDGTLDLHRGVVVGLDGTTRVARVTYRDPADDAEVARLRVVVAPGDGAAPTPHTATGPLALPATRPVRLGWRGRVVPVCRWRIDGGNRHTAEVRAVPAEDLWVLPDVPRTRIPVAALENVVRMAGTDNDGYLALDRITVHDTERPTLLRITGDPGTGRWRATDPSTGDLVLDLTVGRGSGREQGVHT